MCWSRICGPASDPAQRWGGYARGYPGLRLMVTTENGGPDYEDAIARLAADGWVQKTRLAGQLVTTLRRLPH